MVLICVLLKSHCGVRGRYAQIGQNYAHTIMMHSVQALYCN